MRLISVFVVALLSAILFSPALAQGQLVTLQTLELQWSAPESGGPVTEYRAQCADASGTMLLDVVTEATEASASNISDVPVGDGWCEVTARGPGGESDPPASIVLRISVTDEPGTPRNFTLNCSGDITAGTVVCEQA